MNRAQLIDPEWVQRGCPVRYEPARPKDLPQVELRVVTAAEAPVVKPPKIGHRTGLTARICAVLASQERPLTAHEISGLVLDSYARRVSNAMNTLLHTHRVKRSGRWGAYSYEITQHGRDYLA